jgi:hypothetical protein
MRRTNHVCKIRMVEYIASHLKIYARVDEGKIVKKKRSLFFYFFLSFEYHEIVLVSDLLRGFSDTSSCGSSDRRVAPQPVCVCVCVYMCVCVYVCVRVSECKDKSSEEHFFVCMSLLV